MIIILGKTCAGKSEIQKEFIKLGYQGLISFTTRPMRNGETNGVDYHFITVDDFMQKVKDNFFAETTSYNTVEGVWHYASAIEDIDDNKICVLNPDGLRQLKEHKDLNITSIYIKVNKRTLKNSLIKRGDKKAEYKRRLKADKKDFRRMANKVDYVICNNGYKKTPEQLAKEIITILEKRGGQ